MKKIIYLITFILLASICYSLTIENPQPAITTTFSEPVIISSVNATLKDSQNNHIPMEAIFISPDNKTFKHRPLDYLQEGGYIFIILAQDIYGNLGNLNTQSFTIDVPPLSVMMIEPRFQVSPTEIFDIEIETSLPSDCRWATHSNKVYDEMASFFETINEFIHTITDFDIGDLLENSIMYVACKTNYDNSSDYEPFELSVDSTPPIVISIDAVDVTEEPIESTISATTDDKTVCAYSKENVPFLNMTLFQTSNESKYNDYTNTHFQSLSEPILENLQDNTFYIICKNLAGLLSETYTIDIAVDTTEDAVITINKPLQDSYLSTSSVIFNVSTNKLAVCYFSNNSEEITQSGGTFGGTIGRHSHILTPPLFLPAGGITYTYYFKCFIDPPEGQLPINSTTFTIDTTPPTMSYVDDSNIVQGMENLTEFTYYKNRLDVRWHAEDNDSGIYQYNYSIWKDSGYSQDNLTFDWTLVEDNRPIDRSESKRISGLDLEDKAKYYFKFKAQNNAGMWSQEMSSNGITLDLALLFIGTCTNGERDFNETDIDCGGICDKCAINKKCDSNEDCITNFCNSFFIGNDTNTTDQSRCDEFIAEPTCSDNIKNEGETDIDCGGSCYACTTSKACLIDEDCISNYCDQDIKVCIIYDACANNILDQNETDIDCGGTCIPCSNKKSCILNSDCLSEYCSSQTNTCEEETLCGNGVIDSGEQCDNTTGDKTCSLFGLEGGILNCGTDCILNTTTCIGPEGTCEDTIINPGEQCEGTNWGNVKGCFDFNEFKSGKLSCQDCILRTEQCSKEIDPTQDTDDDGMADICELKYFRHRTKARPNDDPDEDGLTNKEECKLCSGSGTDPKEEDTDGDGYKDKKEVEKGTDPCDVDDHPKSSLLLIILATIVILLLFGGSGYYLYSRKIISFTKKPPYLLFSKPIKLQPTLKGPGIIEFIKTPPYIKLNADISFTKKPPFIIFKSTPSTTCSNPIPLLFILKYSL